MLSTPRVALCLAISATLAGCGSGAVPAVGQDRESGQSSLMGKTFAGQCSPKNHEKPFVIEWDATDMAMFESRAATDVVFVQYEGCSLKVLDGCANDSIRGSLGAYRPVEWTSGSIEKVEIKDEGELYASLPLAVASLGARVKAGESFRMEYFVSGVRTATRSAAYKGDLAKIPGCKGATHYVYGISLGAFGLASAKNISGEANATAGLAGANASRVRSSNAEKKGGLIESCRAESAKEVKSCQVPIRLVLREIQEGNDPTGTPAAAAGAPPSSSDKAELTVEEVKLRESAARKLVAKDGKGCIADFDEADWRWPNSPRLSTRPDGMLNIRAQCLMITGDCDTGKKLLRQAYERMGMKTDHIDVVVNSQAGDLCPKK